MNILPTDLQNIIYKYAIQLKYSDVMNELKNYKKEDEHGNAVSYKYFDTSYYDGNNCLLIAFWDKNIWIVDAVDGIRVEEY